MTDKRDKDVYSAPIYQGDEDKDRLPNKGPAVATEAEPVNRGRRARREGSGVVSGSGAAAGGTGGISEDFDEDPVSGGGANVMPTPPPSSGD